MEFKYICCRSGEREEGMSAKLKKVLSFFFIAASVTAVFFIAFSNTELKDAWGAIATLDMWWVAGIFGCWILTFMSKIMLCRKKQKLHFRRSNEIW